MPWWSYLWTFKLRMNGKISEELIVVVVLSLLIVSHINNHICKHEQFSVHVRASLSLHLGRMPATTRLSPGSWTASKWGVRFCASTIDFDAHSFAVKGAPSVRRSGDLQCDANVLDFCCYTIQNLRTTIKIAENRSTKAQRSMGSWSHEMRAIPNSLSPALLPSDLKVFVKLHRFHEIQHPPSQPPL